MSWALQSRRQWANTFVADLRSKNPEDESSFFNGGTGTPLRSTALAVTRRPRSRRPRHGHPRRSRGHQLQCMLATLATLAALRRSATLKAWVRAADCLLC